VGREASARRAALDVVGLRRLHPGEQLAQLAAAEAEGDGSLEFWRTHHEESWRRVLGEGFSPSTDVVLERFELIYPTTGPTPAVD
jgi:uncharacterized protein YhfF